jgi:hypothetical protein
MVVHLDFFLFKRMQQLEWDASQKTEIVGILDCPLCLSELAKYLEVLQDSVQFIRVGLVALE